MSLHISATTDRDRRTGALVDHGDRQGHALARVDCPVAFLMLRFAVDHIGDKPSLRRVVLGFVVPFTRQPRTDARPPVASGAATRLGNSRQSPARVVPSNRALSKCFSGDR